MKKAMGCNHPDLKGIGLVIFEDFILPIIKKASIDVAMKVLYICLTISGIDIKVY